MKRIIIIVFVFTFLMNLTSFCSEKSFLQKKIASFAHKMLSRHSYDEYDSFEHKRDRALLCILPVPISQAILLKQRRNMQYFLKQNEEDALEGVRQYFNLDQEQWSKIIKTFEEEQAFNLNAMKRADTKLGHHDANLPKEYYDAINKETQRYGINKNTLDIGITTDEEEFAHTNLYRPFGKQYRPASLQYNYHAISNDQPLLFYTTIHEFTHIIKSDSLLESIILDAATHEISNKQYLFFEKDKSLQIKIDQLYNKRLFMGDTLFNIRLKELRSKGDKLTKEGLEIIHQIDGRNVIEDNYNSSRTHAVLAAAFEKTADTLIPCQDQQAAKNAFLSIETFEKKKLGYPDNFNDMKIIHANWQTSQSIADFQQFKNSTQQKLNEFPQSLRTIVKA